MMYVWAHLWQFAIVFLLTVRAASAIAADMRSAATRRSAGMIGILVSEATYVSLFVFALWMGGFWR